MEIARYLPDNPNTNIHGMVGLWKGQTCKTKTGKRCTACCTFFRINDTELKKPANKKCDNQVLCNGCDIHDNRPEGCKPYHCSQSNPDIKIELLNIALRHGETSKKEAEDSVKHF